jgi:hypothetical protein
MKKLMTYVAATVLLGIGGGAAIVYSGAFNFAADEPHSPLVFKAIETMRERSIVARLDGIKVPNLDDPALLLAGGPDYRDMCANCHLHPGKANSDLWIGLYPQPPNLARARRCQAERCPPVLDHQARHQGFWNGGLRQDP